MAELREMDSRRVLGAKQSFEWPLCGKGVWLLLAGWVRSPTAASGQSSSKKPGLADRQLCRKPDDRSGHDPAEA